MKSIKKITIYVAIIIVLITSIIFLSFIVGRLFKIFIIYIPLGILAPMLWPKFRNLKKSILLGGVVYLGISSLEIAISLTGMSLVRGIWFDVNDMLVGMLGVLVGYFIYKIKWKRTF